MTVTDLPVELATPDQGPERARVSTRARVMVPVTLRDNKIVAGVSRLAHAVRADLRRWWVLTAEPPSLQNWLSACRTGAAMWVPEDSGALRAVWRVDNWTTGVLFAALSTLFLLAGAVTRWLVCHPARRWLSLLSGAAGAVWMWLA